MTEPRTLPTAQTTVAELLAIGAKITFGSGRTMAGDTRSKYIDVSNEFGSLGMWDLDAKDGPDSAIADLDRDAREHGIDLFGNTTGEDDGEI